MKTDNKPVGFNEARSAFAAEPQSSREERLGWLKAELKKGLDSGIDPRPARQIIEDILKKNGLNA
jgi:hypothetical protein